MYSTQLISTGLTAALLLLPCNVDAQSSNQNLTLRFFPSSEDSSCSYSNTTAALTFTTSSYPLTDHCFTVADLFTSNTTVGFINQTRYLGSGVRPAQDHGIHYSLSNTASFSPNTNYSHILYRQHVLNADDAHKPGAFSGRRAMLYGGHNCSEKDPFDNSTLGLVPWFGFSCWSEEEGSCGATPYNILSFRIAPGSEDGKGRGTCWDFAEYGDAGRVRARLGAVLGGVAGVVGVVWWGL